MGAPALLDRVKSLLKREEFPKEPDYAPLRQKQSHEEQQHYPSPILQTPTSSRILLWLNVGLFIVSVVCLGVSYRQSRQSYTWHLEQTIGYSPFLERLDLGEGVPRLEENELFDRPSAYKIYRGPPSKEVDDAWEAISEVGVVLISGDEVRKVGKNTSKTVKAPPHWGYGDDAYLAQVDGQHRIHCLNVLRKWMHYDHYFKPKLGDDPGIIQLAHRDHCLVLLLQTLTCHVSLDVITHNWMDTQGYPVPDFNMNRKCMSHDRILEWQEKSRISMEQWDEIRPQEGDYVLPLWPELVELNKLHGYNVMYQNSTSFHDNGFEWGH
ncbi:protein of unknown function (DUF3328) domain containing protein [Rhypophila sp. PSN 637]